MKTLNPIFAFALSAAVATASFAQEDGAVEQPVTPKTELITEELGADPVVTGSEGEQPVQETGAEIAVDEPKGLISHEDPTPQTQTSAANETTVEETAPSQPNVQHVQQIQPVSQPSGLRADDQTDRMLSAARQVQEQTAPVALGQAGRVIVTYGEALPVLVCTSLAVCTVELEKGENLVDAPVLGDPVRWIMEQRQVNWPGQEKQWIFVFKPTADADRTSTAVFVTDRRIYSIVLKRHPFQYIPILSFDYPDTRHRLITAQIEAERAAKLKAEADELKRKADAAAAAAARANRAVKASGTKTARGLVPAERLDFNYRVSGRAPFKPAQVYNDGRKTYVVLPASYRGSLPVLLAGESTSNAAINISYKNGRFVIDRLVSSFTLKDGSKTISVTRISS